MLSLDANLGAGPSLHDLVTTDVDLLTHTSGGVFEDERLDRVLCALLPDGQGTPPFWIIAVVLIVIVGVAFLVSRTRKR
jgi:hypothetical protein